MNQSDIHQIAGLLSGVQGTFGANNLVCYGQTAIIKPGAVTDKGIPMTGKQIAAILGSDYSVFPLAVEYAPNAEDALGIFGNDETADELAELDIELDALTDVAVMGSEDEFGLARRRRGPAPKQTKAIRRRYLSIVARFRKCQTLLVAGRGYVRPSNFLLPFVGIIKLLGKKGTKITARARRCDQMYRHLLKVWQKMQRKGVDVSGLPSPEEVKRGMMPQQAPVAPRTRRVPERRGERVVYVDRPVYMQPQQPPPQRAPLPYQYPQYTPTSKAVSPYYLADQAALEREMQSTTPSWGSDQMELQADLRAETYGFAFSGLEHDYFGISGSDVEVIFSDEDDELGAEDELSPGDLADMDDDDDLFISGVEDAGIPKPVKTWTANLSRTGPPVEISLLSNGRILAGGRMVPKDTPLFAQLFEAASSNGSQAAPPDAADIPDDDDDLLDAMGIDDDDDDDDDLLLGLDAGDDLLGDDEDEEDDSDLLGAADDSLGEDDSDLLGASDDDLGDDDSDLLHDIEGNDPELRKAYAESALLKREATPLPDGLGGDFESFLAESDEEIDDLGGSANAPAVNPKVAKQINKKRTALAAKFHKTSCPKKRSVIESQVAKIDSKLKSGTKNGGIDYGRVRPKAPGSPGTPVVMIAIRKRPVVAEVQARNAAVAAYGADVGNHQGSPILLDVLGTDVYRVSTGHTAPQALAELNNQTDASDWIQGGQPFPMGADAPFPPPRQAGPEVY